MNLPLILGNNNHYHKSLSYYLYFIIIIQTSSFIIYSNSRNKRRYRVLIQGRFKKVFPYSQVHTGQVFDEPIDNIQKKWLLRSTLKLISQFQPGFQKSIKAKKPYFLFPLASACQNIGNV